VAPYQFVWIELGREAGQIVQLQFALLIFTAK
jgi:hypothetical protein